MRFGIDFETATPVVASDPNRADIALFVGFVARRPGPLPGALAEWMRAGGWLRDGDWRRTPYRRPPAEVEDLLDVPVPIDSWEQFVRLFRWDERPLHHGAAGARPRVVPTYLGAAVRAFFLQGGRKCYVVRVGEPWAVTTPATVRRVRAAELVPGFPLIFTPRPVDRTTWRGAGHLFGLPDVSLLCLPDLPDIVAGDPPRPDTAREPPGPPEDFVVCGTAEDEELQLDRGARLLAAPRADLDGFRLWERVVRTLSRGLGAGVRREVQLVLAVPLPAEGTRADRGNGPRATTDLAGFLAAEGLLPAALAADDPACSATAFVQLAWPWLRTRLSARLPEGAEPPDGALAGVVARNALARGAFRTAAGLEPAGVHGFLPVLRREEAEGALRERVSVFGPTPGGPRLLSDVTTSAGQACRAGGVKRLVASIVRSARLLGEEAVFEASGEALWAHVEQRLSDLLLGLLAVGALRGRDPAEAFDVRCDRTTMTQADIDAGRLICRLSFQPARAVERITVALALHEGQAGLVDVPGVVAEAV